jgi:hypothetical protein
MSEESKEKPIMSEEFKKVIKDFVLDIKNTFPEFQPLINKWWKDEKDFLYIDNQVERQQMLLDSQNKSSEFLFEFCNKKFPPRFFDILYQNNDIFKEDSEIDTEFLPHIHFKNLWSFEISEKTRETIWKYLQLILFSIVGTLQNKEIFGDTAKLFEGIDESEFKNKLEETLSNMQNLFNFDETNEESDGIGKGSINMENIPNAEEIHEHITGMLDGNLGRLAKEIAEETANDLNIDMENMTDAKSVFNNLMKNPTKLMGLVKNVGDKLDKKIKSGEIKESELISEASDIMNKMKDMPGMGDIQSLLSKMGLGGKNGKVNMNAMESQLNKNMKAAQMKERIKTKLEANKAKEAANVMQQTNNQEQLTDEQLISIFSSGEKAEKTPRRQNEDVTDKKSKKSKKTKK